MAIDQRIYSTLVGDGIPDSVAQIATAQSKYETANYTSNVFKSNNNAFGYKYYAGSSWQLPGQGTMSPEGNAYAAYSSVENSAHELASWLKRRQAEGNLVISSLTSPALYAQALKNNDYYGESASEYAAGITAYYTVIAAAGIGAGVIILVFVALYILKKKRNG